MGRLTNFSIFDHETCLKLGVLEKVYDFYLKFESFTMNFTHVSAKFELAFCWLFSSTKLALNA